MVSTRFVILSDEMPRRLNPGQTAQASATGRYEFRVWPRDLPEAAALLQTSWTFSGAERRSDIYLLTERSRESLVKLRAGNRLEAKRRVGDLGPLQHWTHHPYPMFPLSRRDLGALAEELGVTRLKDDAGLSAGHLVARLGEAAPAILPMTVGKSRLLFRKGSSRAEICRVAIAGWSRLTLAIEDPDPFGARATLDALRLGHLPNRSYGDVLCRRRIAAQPTPVASHPAN